MVYCNVKDLIVQFLTSWYKWCAVILRILNFSFEYDVQIIPGGATLHLNTCFQTLVIGIENSQMK